MKQINMDFILLSSKRSMHISVSHDLENFSIYEINDDCCNFDFNIKKTTIELIAKGESFQLLISNNKNHLRLRLKIKKEFLSDLISFFNCINVKINYLNKLPRLPNSPEMISVQPKIYEDPDSFIENYNVYLGFKNNTIFFKVGCHDDYIALFPISKNNVAILLYREEISVRIFNENNSEEGSFSIEFESYTKLIDFLSNNSISYEVGEDPWEFMIADRMMIILESDFKNTRININRLGESIIIYKALKLNHVVSNHLDCSKDLAIKIIEIMKKEERKLISEMFKEDTENTGTMKHNFIPIEIKTDSFNVTSEISEKDFLQSIENIEAMEEAIKMNGVRFQATYSNLREENVKSLSCYFYLNEIKIFYQIYAWFDHGHTEGHPIGGVYFKLFNELYCIGKEIDSNEFAESLAILKKTIELNYLIRSNKKIISLIQSTCSQSISEIISNHEIIKLNNEIKINSKNDLKYKYFLNDQEMAISHFKENKWNEIESDRSWTLLSYIHYAFLEEEVQSRIDYGYF